MQLHGARKAPFAIQPEAMATKAVIPCWKSSPHRYRKARKLLVGLGILKILHEGGRGPGDPSLFTFNDPTALRVQE